MTRYSLKQGAYCISGILGDTDVPHEPFVTCAFKGISPLWWRIPILLWSSVVLFWSMSFFWGPTEKFFLYMTHWGLLFIVVESVFGIAVAVRKPCGKQAGKISALSDALKWKNKSLFPMNQSLFPMALLRCFCRLSSCE